MELARFDETSKLGFITTRRTTTGITLHGFARWIQNLRQGSPSRRFHLGELDLERAQHFRPALAYSSLHGNRHMDVATYGRKRAYLNIRVCSSCSRSLRRQVEHS